MTALRFRPRFRLGLNAGRRPRLPFAPARLPGLAFWYRMADSTYADGVWLDRSGKSNHARQESGARRPVPTVDGDGRPLLRFDGLDDVLLVDRPPNLAQGVTLFAVYRYRTPVDFRGIFAAAAATGIDHEAFFTLQYAQVSDQQIQVFGRSVQANQAFTRGADSTETQYALVTFEVGATNLELRDLNGVSTDTTTAAPFGTPAAMTIGGRFLNGAPFNHGAVDIYEIGLYQRTLDPAERDLLDDYLRSTYGLAWNPRHLGSDLAWFHDATASAFVTSGGLVDQWDDLSVNGRHWVQSGTARPDRTVDPQGRDVVRFDGVDDIMTLTGQTPELEPFTSALVFRVRNRSDFTGVLSMLPPAGTDHTDLWTLRNGSAVGNEVQLFGRSGETDALELAIDDTAVVRLVFAQFDAGSAEFSDPSGAVSDSYDGTLGAPHTIALGGRYQDAPFGYAEVDVLATIGATRQLTASDQQNLIDWATDRWSL